MEATVYNVIADVVDRVYYYVYYILQQLVFNAQKYRGHVITHTSGFWSSSFSKRTGYASFLTQIFHKVV